MNTKGLPADRVRWHLENWAEHQDDIVGSGYRKTASGAASLSTIGESFDVLVAKEDARCAIITDVCIEDLPVAQQRAIQHVMLASVWRTGSDITGEFNRAVETLGAMLWRRGIE